MPELDDNVRSAINPYRLAEVVADRPINWRNVPDQDEVFKKLLGMTRKQLLSPKHGSPVYAGLETTKDRRLVSISRGAALAGLRLTAQGLPDDDELPRVKLPNVSKAWLEKLDLAARRRVVSLLLPAQEGDESGDWDPPDGEWKDTGDYIKDSIERTDPDQGAVGDCYFIAALASLAFTHPTKIKKLDGNGPHEIKLYTGSNGSTKTYKVSEKLPVRSSNQRLLYAKSTDAGEIWPGVYEKAYAQFRAKTSSDRPNYKKLSGGSGTTALNHLTGWGTHKWKTADESGNELYQRVRAHSLGGRCIWPMVADTYGVDESIPSGGDYGDADIAANHVYSVFGWMFRDDKRYIVLRNPWAAGEGTLNVASGSWNGMTLNEGGLFALEANTFKKYFEHLGVAKDD